MESLTEEETLRTQVSQPGVTLWVGMGGGDNKCQQKGGNQFAGLEQDEQDGVGCYLGRDDLWGRGGQRLDFSIVKSVIRGPMQK